MSSPLPRDSSSILTDLKEAIKRKAERHQPPIDFGQELALAESALQRNNESLAFRALENLVLSAHASGMVPELQGVASYSEAIHVLRMGGKKLPDDL